MSKNGRGKLLNGIREGKKSEIDERNLLIISTIEIFIASDADTLIMENVPEMGKTYIPHPYKHGELINILDFIQESLGRNFLRCIRIIEFADYGVPQCRQRLISIFTKNEKLKSYLQFSGNLFPPPTHTKD